MVRLATVALQHIRGQSVYTHALIFLHSQPYCVGTRIECNLIAIAKKLCMCLHDEIQLKLYISEAAPNHTLLEKHQQLLKWRVLKRQALRPLALTKRKGK